MDARHGLVMLFALSLTSATADHAADDCGDCTEEGCIWCSSMARASDSYCLCDYDGEEHGARQNTFLG